MMKPSLNLLPLILLIAAASSCVSEPAAKTLPHDTINSSYLGGVRAALADSRNHVAAIRVYRPVQPNETDPQTGLPVRDAGTDAADPARAAFNEGYNATITAIASSQTQQPSVTPSAKRDDAFVVTIHWEFPRDLTDDDSEFEIRHGQIAINGTADGRIRIAFGRLSSGTFQDMPGTANLLDQRISSAVQKMPNFLLLGMHDQTRRQEFTPIVRDLLDNRIVLFTGQTRAGRPLSAALELSSHDRQLLTQALAGD